MKSVSLHHKHLFPQGTLFLLLAMAFFMVTETCIAQAVAETQPEATRLEAQLKALEMKLTDASLSLDEHDRLKQSVTDIARTIDQAKEALQQQSDHVSRQLDKLGEEIKNEPAQVSLSRKTLNSEKADLSRQLSHYRLLSVKSGELIDKVDTSRRSLVKQRVFNKGPDVFELAQEATSDGEQSLLLLLEHMFDLRGLRALAGKITIAAALAGIIVLAVSVWARINILKWTEARSWSNTLTGRSGSVLLTTTAYYLPYLVTSICVATYTYSVFSSTSPLPAVAYAFYGLPPLALCLFLTEMLFKPKTPARLFIDIDQNKTSAIARRLQFLLVSAYGGFLLLSTLYGHSQSAHALLLARDMFAVVMAFLLVWSIAALSALRPRKSTIRIRNLVMIILSMTLLAELAGFRELAVLVFRVIASLSISYFVFLLIYKLLNEFFVSLDEGTSNWHRPIRSALGLKRKQHIPGLGSLRVLINITLWLLFLFVISRILGISDELSQSTHKIFIDGFTIGTLHINPARIFLALVLFATLLTFTGWLKVRLDRKWLSATKIDKGVKDALITGSGYVGIVIAVIVALGVAGFTFTNLAIIAGALSVGIGFGLQNIVNNFVSGLILLFERPVKKGDWIIVGNTEGYVKDISIRSTQIQTFDRADVIVPNSDLISNQVTNWMLHDMKGRIRVPVGVAYGSDTEKVKQILMDVANNHDSVIKDDPDRKIRVMFLNFGDSSLNFELRCHIKNVDETMITRSDLNFAIDKAFRENGVEIPFPQRDLHVKHLPHGLGGTEAGLQ